MRLLVNTVCVYSFSRERDDANTKKSTGRSVACRPSPLRAPQDEVAELLGVKRQTVSAWETGVTVPTAFQVADLAAAYCASAHHLLFGAHYERVDVKALCRVLGVRVSWLFQACRYTSMSSPPCCVRGCRSPSPWCWRSCAQRVSQ
ncbi:helix-turn-helix transcriptional regulator [Delftia sp.]|uniref:helix-turn-helix transcriptional regulator n=1 Tax=Delftia sp. TaxID=1886637 RepID=UPI00338EA8F0